MSTPRCELPLATSYPRVLLNEVWYGAVRRVANGDCNCRVLLEEDDRGECACSQRKHQPLEVIAPELAGEMQNQNDDRYCVKSVKTHNYLRLIGRRTAQLIRWSDPH